MTKNQTSRTNFATEILETFPRDETLLFDHIDYSRFCLFRNEYKLL